MNTGRAEICGCCGGTGEVEAADGTQRPCSRCRSDDFLRWSKARQPQQRETERPHRPGPDDDGDVA